MVDLVSVPKHSDLYRRIRIATALNAMIYMYTYTYAHTYIYIHTYVYIYVYKYNRTTAIYFIDTHLSIHFPFTSL